MKKSAFISATFLLLLQLGCRKNIDLQLPPHNPKLVVQAFAETGKRVLVYVSQSQSVTETITRFQLRDARVEVYAGSQTVPVTLFFIDSLSAFSRPGFVLSPGVSYRLEVKYLGLPTASAVSGSGSQISLQSVTRLQNAQTAQDGSKLDNLRLRFNDPAGEANYYLARIFYFGNNSPSCLYSGDPSAVLPSNIINVDPFNSSNCFSGGGILFSDEKFNGQDKTFEFSVDHDVLEPRLNGGIVQYARVELYRFDKNFYQYLKTVSSYSRTFDNPFAEPVTLFSNINGGYGFFSVFTKDVREIR